MGKTGYTLQVEGEGFARAKAHEVDISPKHAIEIARFIRRMNVDDAIAYLEQVAALEKAIPFRRFNKKVAHKRGLPKASGGRYPEKAARAYLRVLASVKKNAEYTGLDTGNLKIVHVAANRGRGFDSFMPRAMGRATPKRRERVNIEIIVKEVE
ncbi:MAG: 50S ribosomal protein L22 [Methanomicrobiales archaeon]|nr:50S ribosomal protein L22 [Methanomicrobiales archaeon]